VRSTDQTSPPQLLLLAADSEAELPVVRGRLRDQLAGLPASKFAAAAAASHAQAHAGGPYRAAILATGPDDAHEALTSSPSAGLIGYHDAVRGRRCVFLLPGIGDHHVKMGRGLYDACPPYRREVDACCDVLATLLGRDLRELLDADHSAMGDNALAHMMGRSAELDAATTALNDVSVVDAAVFAVEHSLAQLWVRWGVRPSAMAGYGIGEYVTACLAGVWTRDAALHCIAHCAALLATLDDGAMLAAAASEQAVAASCQGLDAHISAINTPRMCVASGTIPAIDQLQRRLADANVVHRRLPANRPYHCPLMQPIADAVTQHVRRFDLEKLSNLVDGLAFRRRVV